MSEGSRLYQIAITMLPGVGDILAKNLVAYCGSAEAVFKEKKQALAKIPGIGNTTAAKIASAKPLQRAEVELEFVAAKGVQLFFYLDENYPKRLKHCTDSPILLYYKGNGSLNPERALAMVGTRNATAHGKQLTEQLVASLKPYHASVISGLAYGIDIAAHKAAVDNELPTIGVLAHGLDRIYPALHTKIADQMLEHGGLLTEFPSGTNPDRENFPKRNRIIAGMTDATIVVEAAEKGGALITAEIAHGYNRDVFAVPGRPDDVYSAGCNKLIYLNKAAILRSAKDFEFYLNWESEKELTRKRDQTTLFIDITPQEEPIAEVLRLNGKTHIDALCQKAGLPISQTVQLLFNLELKGAIRTHPGKVYEWLGP
jgi:DNA processing protein